MSKNPAEVLRQNLTLGSLQDAVDDLERLEGEVMVARAERDRIIAELVEDVKMSTLTRVTKLSRQQIWRIAPGRVKDD